MKNIRKFCLVGLLTLCSLLCCACGGGSAKRDHTEDPTDTGSGAATQPSVLDMPYIGILLKSLDNPYFDLIKAGAEDEADALGVEVMVFSPDDEDDTDDQADMLLTMANMAVDVIAIAPIDEPALADGLARAEKNGKIILSVDTALDYDGCACYIGTDNYNAAYQQGQYAAGLVDEGACAVILRGQAEDRAHTLREYGLEDALHDGGVQVLDTKICNSSEKEAEQAMAELLETQQTLHLVCTTSDSMAVGAQRAIAQAGRSDSIHIVSFDGMQEVSELVRVGEIDAVFAQDAYEIGRECVRTAVRLYQGEEVPETIHTDVELITQGNAQEHMDEVNRRLRHKKTK
ncbi:MAG: sugar ABC transporter substrate-binding protein [Butyricicoccus porcorum]|nr:sugar ABC transporter substrate-binding protein [Butyricicoccus porcorum]MDD6987734.1 sugar ABC transporter substrate-binding protein [Butyricicoccus porcorum]MDY4483348.1 sugar ABC transporter substrate-binding protein [Butyricicoccus porcorum]